VQSDLVTQEEAFANADLAANLLWLINSGLDTKAEQEEAEPDGPSFTECTPDR